MCNFIWRNGAVAWEEALTQVDDELYRYLRTWALQHFLNAIMPAHGTGAPLLYLLNCSGRFSPWATIEAPRPSVGLNLSPVHHRQCAPPTATARSHSPRYSYTQGRASQKPEHELHGGASVVCAMWW